MTKTLRLKEDYSAPSEDCIPAGTMARVVETYRNGNAVIEFANGAAWNDITPQEMESLFTSIPMTNEQMIEQLNQEAHIITIAAEVARSRKAPDTATGLQTSARNLREIAAALQTRIDDLRKQMETAAAPSTLRPAICPNCKAENSLVFVSDATHEQRVIGISENGIAELAAEADVDLRSDTSDRIRCTACNAEDIEEMDMQEASGITNPGDFPAVWKEATRTEHNSDCASRHPFGECTCGFIEGEEMPEQSRNIEYVLWGIPKESTDRLDEKVLYTQAKTPAQLDTAKERAAADGWHSFRVQVLDLNEKPNFASGLKK